jgi:hypothetical protein
MSGKRAWPVAHGAIVDFLPPDTPFVYPQSNVRVKPTAGGFICLCPPPVFMPVTKISLLLRGHFLRPVIIGKNSKNKVTDPMKIISIMVMTKANSISIEPLLLVKRLPFACLNLYAPAAAASLLICIRRLRSMSPGVNHFLEARE